VHTSNKRLCAKGGLKEDWVKKRASIKSVQSRYGINSSAGRPDKSRRLPPNSRSSDHRKKIIEFVYDHRGGKRVQKGTEVFYTKDLARGVHRRHGLKENPGESAICYSLQNSTIHIHTHGGVSGFSVVGIATEGGGNRCPRNPTREKKCRRRWGVPAMSADLSRQGGWIKREASN